MAGVAKVVGSTLAFKVDDGGVGEIIVRIAGFFQPVTKVDVFGV